MVKGIAHICLGAASLDEATRFYCEGLGLRKKFRFLNDGKEFGFYLDAGNGTYIEIFTMDSPQIAERPAIRHLCLEVDSIDTTAKRLKAHGIAMSEKKLGKDNSWQAWIKDPTGIGIELHEYTPKSCQITGEDCV